MAYPPEAYAPQRPAALTAMVVCLVIIGILQVFVGVVLYALAFPFVVCDGFYLVLAVLAFVVSAGLWQMAGWARASAIVLGIIAAILNFPLGTVPAVILLVYIYKPEVKYAFGQGPPVAPPMWGYAPPYGPGQGAYPLPYPPAYPKSEEKRTREVNGSLGVARPVAAQATAMLQETEVIRANGAAPLEMRLFGAPYACVRGEPLSL